MRDVPGFLCRLIWKESRAEVQSDMAEYVVVEIDAVGDLIGFMDAVEAFGGEVVGFTLAPGLPQGSQQVSVAVQRWPSLASYRVACESGAYRQWSHLPHRRADQPR